MFAGNWKCWGCGATGQISLEELNSMSKKKSRRIASASIDWFNLSTRYEADWNKCFRPFQASING